MIFPTLLVVLSSLTLLRSEKFDYYWRDYVGEIPEDAFPGGQDRKHAPTYIGQVYIPNQGLLIGPIIEGVKSVTTTKVNVLTSDVFVKILCTNSPEKLSWVPVFVSDVKFSNGTYPIAGGTENGEILNIGRVAYQGEIIIGKVCRYEIKNKSFYFAYHAKELAVTNYEMLVYNKNA